MECLLYEKQFHDKWHRFDIGLLYSNNNNNNNALCGVTVRTLFNSDRIYSVVYIETVKLCVVYSKVAVFQHFNPNET